MEFLEEFIDKELNLPALSAPFIEIVGCEQKPDNHLQCHVQQPFGVSPVVTASVSSFMTLDDIKTIQEIILSLPENTHEHLPGDTIGILTYNNEDEVNFLLQQMGHLNNCDDIYKVQVTETTSKKNAKLPVYVPEIITIRKLLAECLDIRSIPKKLFIRSILSFVEDKNEKRLLEILCSKEGALTYDSYIIQKEITFIKLMKQLKTCRPPIPLLIEHLPRLMPRPYSIANTKLGNENSLRIIFKKVGLTTSYLEKAATNSLPVHIYFRQRNHFVYNEENMKKHVIMIGPGVGIAPFLGFLEHRCELKEEAGSTWLFTGFRHKTKDLLYQDKYKYLHSGTLNDLSEAFSQDEDSKFKYVQDQILNRKEKFVQVLSKPDAKVFVCGDKKNMLPDIQASIVRCFAEVLKIDEPEAKNMILDYKKTQKYVEDIWI